MATTLLERLAQNSLKTPSKVALSFLKNEGFGGEIEKQFTYEEISTGTDQLADHLLERGLQKGDTAVLVYPPSLDFIIAFLACLKAGIVAVPVFPPHPSRRDTLLMFSGIVASSDAKFALTNNTYNYLKKLSSLKDTFTRLKRASGNAGWPDQLDWIVTDKVKIKKNKAPSSFSPVSPSDLAFLQYTSGSTSEPKGVMITHDNLSDNLIKITTELEAHDDDTIVVSWLPQYHDMGLIGSYLGVLFCGGSGYYMSPLTFLQNTSLWIEAISKYSGTHLQAPNFAFQLTARKFNTSLYRTMNEDGKSKQSLDLSSVRHIINAAEPVTETSINSFFDKFSKYGLREDVMFPTYGLAEHTVFVCSGGKQRLTVSKNTLETYGVVKVMEDSTTHDEENTSRLIGCGFPSRQNVDVKIVNTDTFEQLGENEVGEIWIHSNSKAAGYYKKPNESEESFGATICGAPMEGNSSSPRKYLRTGDLGFLHENELFICGRIKDLIILGGRNYYPQDIESTAESSNDLIRPGCSAAFTVDPISGNNEEVAMVLELREVSSKSNLDSDCEEIIQKLRAAVNQEHSLALTYVVLLRPRTVPKTTSGKIARAWCRKAFQNNSLNAIYKKSFSTNNATTNERMSPMEIEPTSATSPNEAPDTQQQQQPPGNAKDIRNMDKSVILKKLTTDISRIMSIPPDTIDKSLPLSAIMDSLNLSQFKGMIENGYQTKLSDEYLFRDSTNLIKLVEVVSLGYAPDDADGDGGHAQSSAVAQNSEGGIAQALGCPPGVVCCAVM